MTGSRPAAADRGSAEPPRPHRKEPALDQSALPHDDLSSALAAARAGDEAAFVTVWRALHPPLLRYLTVRGDEAPEDIASETWMHVVRGLGGFEGDAPAFRAWLFTIARHRAIDQGRARSRRPVVPVAEPASLPVREGGGAEPAPLPVREVVPSAEEQAVARDATSRELALVATLPPAQAEMVMLRVVAGLEVADVARLVDKKPGAVRVAVHRALQSLAQHPDARQSDVRQSDVRQSDPTA